MNQVNKLIELFESVAFNTVNRDHYLYLANDLYNYDKISVPWK